MRLIDADVLKQHIDKLPALPDGNFAGNHSALKALINMQPTIEERKTGKWISCENETGEGSNTYKCSACGEIQMMLDGTPKENGWKYCPHCAAKMDEDNENG